MGFQNRCIRRDAVALGEHNDISPNDLSPGDTAFGAAATISSPLPRQTRLARVVASSVGVSWFGRAPVAATEADALTGPWGGEV